MENNKNNTTQNAEELLALAEAGDSDAMLALGDMYFAGEGLAKNYAEMAKWYLAAAEAGNISAMCRLDIIYSKGMGVNQSAELALKWNRAAAEAGDVHAMMCLGRKYQRGIDIEQDAEEAEKWYRTAAKIYLAKAEEGDVDAMYQIAHMYFCGIGIERGESEAKRWYLAAANNGSPIAAYCLSSLCELPPTRFPYEEQSCEESEKWMRIAIEGFAAQAEEGDVDAVDFLEYLYTTRMDLDQKGKYGAEIAKWYHAAAEAGDDSAMMRLGKMYAEGDFVKKSAEESKKWYLAAFEKREQQANAGVVSAMVATGTMCRLGQGVEQSAEEALRRYLSAAERGSQYAMHQIGEMYLQGDGVEQSLSESMKWYLAAAEARSTDAMGTLAAFYLCGKCVEKDLDEAEKWLRKGGTSTLKEFVSAPCALFDQPEHLKDALTLLERLAEDGNEDAEKEAGRLRHSMKRRLAKMRKGK